jgi:hypothetical protein
VLDYCSRIYEVHVHLCAWYTDVVSLVLARMEVAFDAIINEGNEACCDDDTGMVVRECEGVA